MPDTVNPCPVPPETAGGILQGACNLKGVVRALHAHCLAFQGDSEKIREDASVVLIIAKLADMVGIDYQWSCEAKP